MVYMRVTYLYKNNVMFTEVLEVHVYSYVKSLKYY